MILDQYEKTIYVEEALHRLVELYYTIGLESESQKYASLLGYNYQSSEWYERSYEILNKNYKKVDLKKDTDNQKILLKRLKELFK